MGHKIIVALHGHNPYLSTLLLVCTLVILLCILINLNLSPTDIQIYSALSLNSSAAPLHCTDAQHLIHNTSIPLPLDTWFHRTNCDLNISSNPSLPALAIIGPAKTGTTSIYESLLQSYPQWYRQRRCIGQSNPWEIGTFVLYTVQSLLHTQHHKLANPVIIDFIQHWRNHTNVRISRFPFWRLLYLLNHTALQQSIVQHLQYFMMVPVNRTEDIVAGYDSEHMRYQYYVDKTPMNFYLPHMPLIFGYFYSYRNILKNVRGLKVLCILRNPFKRFRSWYSQNNAGTYQRMKAEPEKFAVMFKRFCIDTVDRLMNESILIEMHRLIKNRRDEYDDTLIVLKWLTWYYGEMGYKLHAPLHGFFASLYYPQLLLYVHLYKQLGLIENSQWSLFKVMSFDYVVENGENAVHLIQCWVQFSLHRLSECLHAVPMPKTTESANHSLPKLNSKSIQFPESAKRKLIIYFLPIMERVEQLLRQYPSVLLGDFEGVQFLTH